MSPSLVAQASLPPAHPRAHAVAARSTSRWLRNDDLSDLRCRGALGDIRRQQRERGLRTDGLHVPPDVVVARQAGRDRWGVAQRRAVTLEGGKGDAALAWLMTVVEHVAGHAQ